MKNDGPQKGKKRQVIALKSRQHVYEDIDTELRRPPGGGRGWVPIAGRNLGGVGPDRSLRRGGTNKRNPMIIISIVGGTAL
jgi:hypothetical protein